MDYRRAISELRAELQSDPRNVRLLLKLGDLHTKLGEVDDAADAYEAGACVYAELGQTLRAVACYKQVARVNDKRGHAHVRLAELYDELDLEPSELRLPHVRATRPANRVLIEVDGAEVFNLVVKHFLARSIVGEVIDSPEPRRSYLLLSNKVSFETAQLALEALDANDLEAAFAS